MVWFFDRGEESLACEVRRSDAAFEVVIIRSDGTLTVQAVETPQQLLEQIEAVPQALRIEGWQPRRGVYF